MARGRFGRRRRNQSQNMAALVSQLLTAQRASEDRAIEEAWRNGGLYQGKAVTDETYMAHLTARRDSFDKSDPSYDLWNDAVIQTGFSIGEQKIGLAFKQGKVGAGAVAAFYRSQLGKIPKNSQFYREVAGRAAEWAKAAGAAARGAARSRLSKILKAKIDAQQAIVATYDGMEQVLTEVARRAGIIAGTQTLTDAKAEDIARLFDMGITIGKQTLTYGAWQDAARASYTAQRQVIVLSEQAGRTTKTKREQLQKFIDRTLVRINAVDDRAKYEAARSWFQAEMDKTSDPRRNLDTVKQYLDMLGNIRDAASGVTGEQANDPEFIGAIGNEITALVTGKASGPTVTDLQSNTGEGVVTNDAEFLATMMTFTDPQTGKTSGVFMDLQKLADHTGFYGQDEPGGELQVLEYKANAAFDPTGKNGLGKSYAEGLISEEGDLQVAQLKGAPVYATVLLQGGVPVDPASLTPEQLAQALANGQLVRHPTEQAIGYVFTQPSGKVTYGVVTPNGMVFTDANPFDGLALGDKGTFNIVANANKVGTGFVFDSGVGLTPAAVAALRGERTSGTNIIFDPLLVDNEAPPSELAALQGQGNPALDAIIAKRREEAQRNTALRTQRQYGEVVPTSLIGLQRAGQAVAEQSPFAQALRPVADIIGNLVKSVMTPPSPASGTPHDYFPTIPTAPSPSAHDLFGPPPPAPTFTYNPGPPAPLPAIKGIDFAALQAQLKATGINFGSPSSVPGKPTKGRGSKTGSIPL